jgi:hypothetical protein
MGKKIYMLGQLLQEELSKFSIRALKPRRSGKKNSLWRWQRKGDTETAPTFSSYLTSSL